MRVIESPRLVLEPQCTAHAQAMFTVLSDPAIYTYENAPPASLEWLQRRFAALEARHSPDGREQWLNWVLRLRAGELIGFVQATVQAEGRASIAYELASAHWGCGLASEAVEAMTSELAAHFGVHTLAAVFKRTNTRSRRLLERQGFRPVASAAVDDDEDMMQRTLTATGTPR